MKCIMNLSVNVLRVFSPLLAATVAVLLFVGCADDGTGANTGGSDHEAHEDLSHAAHHHGAEGPHHGTLVELGNDEFHAEVVHGDDGLVVVYILDSAANVAVPIDAPDITISVSHDGKSEQFKLTASREDSAPEGKSSRFALSDEKLVKALDDHDATAKLLVMIDGKSFTGKVSHDHDHGHTH